MWVSGPQPRIRHRQRPLGQTARGRRPSLKAVSSSERFCGRKIRVQVGTPPEPPLRNRPPVGNRSSSRNSSAPEPPTQEPPRCCRPSLPLGGAAWFPPPPLPFHPRRMCKFGVSPSRRVDPMGKRREGQGETVEIMDEVGGTVPSTT